MLFQQKNLTKYLLIIFSAILAYGVGYYLGATRDLSSKTLSSYDFLNTPESTQLRSVAKESQ